MLVGFAGMPHPDVSTTSPTVDPVPFATAPAPAPISPSSVAIVFDNKVSLDELRDLSPQIYGLFDLNWQASGYSASPEDFARLMARRIDGQIRRQTGALDPHMLKDYWRLERDIERNLLTTNNVDGCIARMHGSSELASVSPFLQKDAAAFRARYVRAQAPYEEVAAPRSRGIMIPGRIVSATIQASKMQPDEVRRAMADSGPLPSRCRVHVALLTALLTSDSSSASSILKQM